ncbi:MAG TPA: hypothetical protein VMM82_13330 [Spirochaetia bacterium]|nr:hypothetical protein [Spirochaetia bacterium]
MKKLLAALALLACLLPLPAGAESFLPSVELWGSVSFGALGSGLQKDFPDGTLSPKPDSYTAFLPMIGLRGYLIGPVGLEASSGFFGTTRATADGYQPLDLYNYFMINAGPVVRLGFRTGARSAVAILLGGGVNYSFPSYANDFKSVWASMGLSLADLTSDVGWYGKAGFAWYPFPGLFLDTTFWYYYMNAKNTNGVTVDGTYYLFAFSIGFGI